MTVDPPEEHIGNLVSFCSELGRAVSRHDAIRYLKVKNNDVNAAFEAIFSGEDISSAEQAMTWDEGAWSQGKDGPGAGGNDGMQDPHLRPLLTSAAPTRNNSPARSYMHPSSKQEEDADLARAMAMSQGNEYYEQQEMGTVSSGGQETQFGPANRNDYDPRQWSMVPVDQSSSGEIVPDAELEGRVGKKGEPRMLKQIPGNGEYLANLLTILSNVRGARDALLMRDSVKMDYGEDGEWWKGHDISMPKIVALGEAAGSAGEEDQYDDLLVEVQRLMAFLSASERSYGSAGALMHTDAIKSASTRSVRSNTMLELFMQTWGVAAVAKAGVDSGLERLFSTTIGTNASEGMVDTDMTLVDMPVDASPDSNTSSDLLELMDGLLWDTSDPKVSSDNYIERPAEILVMCLRQRISGRDASKPLKVMVPPEFFLDKYLHEHIESTRATRAEMAKGKKKVEKVEQIERKLRMWRNPKDGKEIDASKLVGHTLKYYDEANRVSSAADGEPESQQHSDIADKLTAVVASIDAKLTTLAEEKEKALATIAAMSRAPPPGLAHEEQQHRYILRGVATKPNITYVLAHEGDDDDDDDGDNAEGAEAFDDADDSTYPGMRWWRLEYEVEPSGLGAKVSKVRVGDYDVLRAVELEHEKAMLVYGSLNINSAAGDYDEDEDGELAALPTPLQQFVKRDNALFAAECDAERSKPPAYQASFDFTQGNDGDSGIGVATDGADDDAKRLSMDSTRAEGGASRAPSPPDYEDVGGFERHHSFGLGPDLKGGVAGDVDDAPVAEIRLDGDDEGVEMVEKAHGPLVSVKGGEEREDDVEMGEGK